MTLAAAFPLVSAARRPYVGNDMSLMIAILIGVAVIVLILRRLLGSLRLPAAKPWISFLGFVLGIAGIWLAIVAFGRVTDRIATRDWPTAEGRIVESTVTGDRSFAPRITYEFEVAGKQFGGTSDRNVPLFGNKRRNMEVAAKEIEAYPVGAPVTVYYHPKDPSQSTIMPEPRWNDYAQSGLGVFLFAAGLFVVTLPIARRSLQSRIAET